MSDSVSPVDGAPFHFSFTTRFDDYLAMIRALRTRGIFGRWHVVTEIAIFMGLYAALVFYLIGGDMPLEFLLSWAVIGYTLGLVVFLVVLRLAIDNLLYRWVFRRNRAAGKEIAVAMDDEGVHWTSNNTAGHLLWPAFIDYRERADLLILIAGKIEAIALPRRGIAESGWPKAVAFAKARVSRAHGKTS